MLLLTLKTPKSTEENRFKQLLNIFLFINKFSGGDETTISVLELISLKTSFDFLNNDSIFRAQSFLL